MEVCCVKDLGSMKVITICDEGKCFRVSSLTQGTFVGSKTEVSGPMSCEGNCPKKNGQAKDILTD